MERLNRREAFEWRAAVNDLNGWNDQVLPVASSLMPISQSGGTSGTNETVGTARGPEEIVTLDVKK
ncbi:MAG: hypothetical protein ACREQO_16725 [Candidatus Binatia bacterium]